MSTGIVYLHCGTDLFQVAQMMAGKEGQFSQ